MPVDGGEIVQLTDTDMKAFRKHTQDGHPMWGSDGAIYFMSEKDGVFNIWKIQPDGSGMQQVTSHDGDGIQYPSMSPDGTTIVYESEFEIWSFDVASRKRSRISIELTFDPKDNLISVTTNSGNPDGFSPNKDGSYIAVGHHGELFLVPADPKKGEKTRITDSPWRERSQRFSPDGTMLAYISDESHEDEIWVYDVKTKEHRKLTDHESAKGSMRWSPDSKTIIWPANKRLFMTDVTTGDTSQLANNPEGGFSTPSFSKDGNFLVYSRSNPDLNSEVYIFDIERREETNVTDNIFSDRAGFLTADNSHVVFSSNRTGSWQLYAVSLSKLTQDPNDPLAKKKKSKKKSSDDDDDKKSDDDKEEGEETEADTEKDVDIEEDVEEIHDPIEIDLNGISDRAQRISTGNGSVGTFFPSSSFTNAVFTRGNDLLTVKFDGTGQKSLGSGGFFRIIATGDGKKYFYERSSALYHMGTSGGRATKVDFSFRFYIDQRGEWEQVFEEAWRVMKYRFYDENMHGVNWAAMREKYLPLLAYVGENQDLYDLANEMIGELNASHTGVSGPATRTMPRLYSTQHLGFEMAPEGESYIVTSIYDDGPADYEWIDLNIGDAVLSVDGTPIEAGDNYRSLLNDPLNNYVTVRVASPVQEADGVIMMTNERDVRIDTVGSMTNIKYNAWVKSRRALVDEWSDNKVGYVHIRSMNQSSLAKFRTEIDQFWNKNGMIIDIRFNGGGNIDQQLIDILEREPYEYWNSRQGGRAAGRRPRQAIAGPKVMLINWRSASDSEVTPLGFRDLKLGTVVGTPTMGAVIATGSYRLLNGASIRTPGALVVSYDASKPNNYGINLENYGVAPDVWVENSPQDELDGYDRELHTAVKTALEQLKKGDWQFGEDK